MPTTNADTQNIRVVRKRQARTWIWTAVCVLIALTVVVLLSAIDGPDGKPLLDSSILVQLLSFFTLVSAATLPALIGSRKDAAVVREQVENTHVANPEKVSNVRDDLDHKHGEVLQAVSELADKVDKKFDAVDKKIEGTRKDIGRVADQGMRTQDAIITLADRVDRNKDSVEIVTKALEIRVSTLEEGKADD